MGLKRVFAALLAASLALAMCAALGEAVLSDAELVEEMARQLNDWLGSSARELYDIALIRDALRSSGTASANGPGLYLYADVLAGLEEGDFERSVREAELLASHAEYAEFRAFLSGDAREAELPALAPADTLVTYANARRAENGGDAEAARAGYNACLSYFDSLPRYADLISAPTEASEVLKQDAQEQVEQKVETEQEAEAEQVPEVAETQEAAPLETETESEEAGSAPAEQVEEKNETAEADSTEAQGAALTDASDAETADRWYRFELPKTPGELIDAVRGGNLGIFAQIRARASEHGFRYWAGLLALALVPIQFVLAIVGLIRTIARADRSGYVHIVLGLFQVIAVLVLFALSIAPTLRNGTTVLQKILLFGGGWAFLMVSLGSVIMGCLALADDISTADATELVPTELFIIAACVLQALVVFGRIRGELGFAIVGGVDIALAMIGAGIYTHTCESDSFGSALGESPSFQLCLSMGVLNLLYFAAQWVR